MSDRECVTHTLLYVLLSFRDRFLLSLHFKSSCKFSFLTVLPCDSVMADSFATVFGSSDDD